MQFFSSFFSLMQSYSRANNSTLLGPMEFSITLHTIKSGWSIVYIEGSRQVIISKEILCFFFLKNHFISANSVDPDEMPHFL